MLSGYGLTETSPILTFNVPGQVKLESVGRPIKGVELRIQREMEGESGQGEIQAKGPNVFSGYWNDPQATAEAFRSDGFFRTGDLGYLDDDGFLYVVGRSKELIVLAGGKKVFPEEVETVFAQSKLVREVGVLEHQGRLVALFVPAPEAIRDESLEDLRRELREEVNRLSQPLPPYERLAGFAITRQPLPRTQIRKLRRQELPELYAREIEGRERPKPAPIETEADRELIESPPASDIWAWLNERFLGQPLTLDTSPQFDLNLDSFDWMSLAMELEERFGVRLSEDALSRVLTLRDLLQESLEAAASGAGIDEAEARRLSPEQERWLAPRGTALTALAVALYGLNRVVMHLLFRVRAHGSERLPEEGPLLIAPNHVSYLDPFAIAAALPLRRARHLYWAGWTGLLFRGPVTKLFSRATQVVPVDPERGLTSTLALARAVLEQGKQLVWLRRAVAPPTVRCIVSCPASAGCSTRPALGQCRCSSTAASRLGRRVGLCRGRARSRSGSASPSKWRISSAAPPTMSTAPSPSACARQSSRSGRPRHRPARQSDCTSSARAATVSPRARPPPVPYPPAGRGTAGAAACFGASTR